MGTRKSRHNKGRKPFYKEHRLTAAELLARPIWGGQWLNRSYDWTDDHEERLATLSNANASIDGSADALGRTPYAIAYRARQIGLELSPEWSAIIRPKPRLRESLCYPYIIKQRDEHADLLAVNEIVPKAFPSQMRGDICQEIMLALLEGRVTMDDLVRNKTRSAWFFRKFYHDNFEQDGHALSLTGLDGDDRTSDDIAASLTAKNWFHDQFAERTRYGDSLQRFTAPTQLEETYHNQIGRYRNQAQELGHFLSYEEADELLSAE